MSKKILLISALAAVTIFSSCREKPPYINFGDERAAKDSTYTAAVEAPQAHVILVEEFTGASCSNCPAARTILTSLEAQHPGRLAVMALHINNFPQSNPVAGSTHDFRTNEGTDIGNAIYGSVGAMPSAGFDRREGIGNINPPVNSLAVSGMWSGIISKYLDTVPPVNLSVTSELNTAGDTAYITVKAAYTKTVSAKNTLTVAIIESNLVDKQDSDIYEIEHYTFNHVLRGFVSPTLGSPVLDSIPLKAAGRVFTRSFLYKVNPDWKAEDCKVVVFMSNAETGDRHVLQAAETELKHP